MLADDYQHNTEDIPPEWASVFRHIQELELQGAVLAIVEKIEVARRMGWTGKIEIDIQTGNVRGGPTIKAA